MFSRETAAAAAAFRSFARSAFTATFLRPQPHISTTEGWNSGIDPLRHDGRPPQFPDAYRHWRSDKLLCSVVEFVFTRADSVGRRANDFGKRRLKMATHDRAFRSSAGDGTKRELNAFPGESPTQWWWSSVLLLQARLPGAKPWLVIFDLGDSPGRGSQLQRTAGKEFPLVRRPTHRTVAC